MLYMISYDAYNMHNDNACIQHMGISVYTENYVCNNAGNDSINNISAI